MAAIRAQMAAVSGIRVQRVTVVALVGRWGNRRRKTRARLLTDVRAVSEAGEHRWFAEAWVPECKGFASVTAGRWVRFNAWIRTDRSGCGASARSPLARARARLHAYTSTRYPYVRAPQLVCPLARSLSPSPIQVGEGCPRLSPGPRPGHVRRSRPLRARPPCTAGGSHTKRRGHGTLD